MGVAENKTLVQCFIDAANRGDMDECVGYLADDVIWTNIGSMKYSGSYHGKATLVSKLLQPVFGQLKGGLHTAVDNVIAEGDRVAVQSRGSAETIEGKRYDSAYCHVFRIRGKTIVEVTEYLDTQLAAAVLR